MTNVIPLYRQRIYEPPMPIEDLCLSLESDGSQVAHGHGIVIGATLVLTFIAGLVLGLMF